MPPKKRRQYGSGGLSLRKDGLWMGRIDAGTYPNGKRRQVCVYGATEAEAKAKLDRKRKQIAAEGNAVATKTRATVKSWSATWLTRRERDQRPKAYAADVSLMKNWIVPTIGTRRLENLSPADVEAVTEAQRAAGLVSSTRRRTHSVLIQMLKAAILEGHDVPQRVLLVKAPPAGSNDRVALHLEEAIAILGVATTALPHATRWASPFMQGLRPNESLGLTWTDGVDFKQDRLIIQWQLQPLPYIDPRDKSRGFRVPDGYRIRHLVGQWHLVELKTESGYRVIPMIPWFKEALLAWREIAPPSPYGLVWPALDGSPADPDDDVDEWRRLQDSAAVQVDRPVMHPKGERYYVRHEGRHTCATLLLAAGIDPKVVTEILGHSSIVTSQGYQHVQTRMAVEALEAIATQLRLPAVQPLALSEGL